MLKEAASKANPTKYAQNKRHGMYEGTPSMINLAPERCSAPKLAKGMAKHKLLRTTTLSRPLARAMSVFVAHSATRKSKMPAAHIETAVREISKSVTRMVVCMWIPNISSHALSGEHFPVHAISDCTTGVRVDLCTPIAESAKSVVKLPAPGLVANPEAML